jgi:hypothetical protein
MKSSLVILALVAALAAPALAVSHTSAAPTSTAVATKLPQSVMYGHVKTMTRKGRRFEIKFDPAWWLTGVAAERAKLQDTGSSDVPNDYYILEEGHRLLTFVVLPSARVTVLTGGGAQRTGISAGELAQLVNGRNPNHRRLSEPKAGFWIRVGVKYPNPAVTLDQQYQP